MSWVALVGLNMGISTTVSLQFVNHPTGWWYILDLLLILSYSFIFAFSATFPAFENFNNNYTQSNLLLESSTKLDTLRVLEPRSLIDDYII